MAAGEGLVVRTPSSITFTGTSASVTAAGGIDLNAATTLQVNGVFDATYTNYVIVISHDAPSGTPIYARYRAAGSDHATDYAYQSLVSAGATTASSRQTSQTEMKWGESTDVLRSADVVYVYGPYLAEPPIYRNINVHGIDSARIQEFTGTTGSTTQFDGFSLFFSAGDSMTGNVTIYGYEE